MRIALLALTFVGLVFISGIVYSLLTRGWWLLWQSSTGWVNTNVVALNETDRELIRTVQRLEDRIELLETGKIWWKSGSTWESYSWADISKEFLKKIEPTITLKAIPNTDIYGISSLSYIPYSTYRDTQFGIIIYALRIPYESFVRTMEAVPKDQFTTNPTNSFPFSGFYVNATKADGKVRLVTKFENQPIAIEIPKEKFPLLKALLLKTDAPAIPIKTWSVSKTGSTKQSTWSTKTGTVSKSWTTLRR